MKYVDDFRNQEQAEKLARAIRRATTTPHTLMEICGGQTHAIVRFGIDALLPEEISLVHGPGCPVCVTPVGLIDKAIELARRPDVVLCSFGDMLRVPGSETDLLHVRAEGGDVRIVYSPLDAVALAKKHPDREVVFFAVGFETTAPANALAVYQAHRDNVPNFSILSAHVLVPPAMRAILSASACQIDGFLAAGHVCAVMGYWQYEDISKSYNTPIVVTGFEPVDILLGVLRCVELLESGNAAVVNAYARSVQRDGNQRAQELMREVFEVTPRRWRGLGEIPGSGLGLRPKYQGLDAERRFTLAESSEAESTECISGSILQGIKKPFECPAYGTRCTPESPLGAPMVSSEGACAAYYRYRRSSAAARG